MCCRNILKIFIVLFLSVNLVAEVGSSENDDVSNQCKLCKEYRKDSYGNTITIQIPAEYADVRATYPGSPKSVCIPCDCGDGKVDVIETSHENSCPNNVCGDPNKPEDTSEQCDDGNNVGFDGCTADCKKEVCGDGIKQPINFDKIVEQCDDGAGNSNTKDKCRTNCQLPECGDEIVDTNEQCDLGTKNADTLTGCDLKCREIVCGDGKVTGAEQCDDANTDNTDGCTNTCSVPRCGDGFVRSGVEQCDDGNTVNNDACTNACTTPRCGDAIVHAGEECDDGNAASNDYCTTSCKNKRCGDGIIQPGEHCDGGAGCTASCTPSSPPPPVCHGAKGYPGTICRKPDTGSPYAPTCNGHNSCGQCTGWYCPPRKKGCFPYGEKITLADGSLKVVEDIRKGDQILNPVTGKVATVNAVVEGPEYNPIIEFGFGTTKLKTSSEHIVVTEKGYKKARELSLDDSVLAVDGLYHRLETISELPLRDSERVINFILGEGDTKVEDHLMVSGGIVTGDLYLQNNFDELVIK